MRDYDGMFVDSNPFMVAVYIRYDPRYTVYSRQVYSILMMLGDIGGLQQSLYYIGFVIVAFFAKRMFVSSILKEMYQTKYERGAFDDPMKGSRLFRKKENTVKLMPQEVFA